MKIHVKKKLYRSICKDLARKGLMNKADGTWGKRPSGADQNSMSRDYFPQSA